MANRIHRLPPGLAEKIAAGEVIERPASVVKELLENSLDAGATEVQVTLEEGGKNLIEVLDNGCGMGPDDLTLCIERHATSKLSSIEDLEKIQTLGFRGEALPSVAAVSELSILSRPDGQDQAYELRAGDIESRLAKGTQVKKITFGHFLHSPHGTRIRATGLFSSIPARLKFLKSAAAEVSAVREWMERLALAYPSVGFKLLSGERTVLDLRPQSEPDRARQILSDGEDFPILSADSDQDGMRDLGLKIRLHWLQGMSAGSSKKLIQVVNKRAIRDRLLQQALLAPFRQLHLPGQFPAAALLIEINPAAIDVNVHPTKAEIRFLDSRKIFSTIHELVRKLVTDKGAPAIPYSLSESYSEPPSFKSQPDFQQTQFSSQPRFERSFQKTSRENWGSVAQELEKGLNPSFLTTDSTPEFRPEPLESRDGFDLAPSPSKPCEELTSPPRGQFSSDIPTRFSGYLFQTYFMMEQGEDLILVDQHAAHERIRFEKLKKGTEQVTTQALLIPEMIRFRIEFKESVEKGIHELAQNGFDVEFFSEDTVIYRGVPADWGNRDLKMRLKNLTDSLSDLRNLDPSVNIKMDSSVFESLASQACHSAVRAGDPLEKEEMEQLYQDLLLCEHPWNCPHGRPTTVKISKSKIEEWFLRKVVSTS